jgi:hypothetical protein
MARFVAIAILLAIAAGIFGVMQMSSLNVASQKLAIAEKELADIKKRTAQNATVAQTAAADLASCRDQVTELQTALETASKKPAAKR